MRNENCFYCGNFSIFLKITRDTLEKPGLVIIAFMKKIPGSYFLISLFIIHDYFWEWNPCCRKNCVYWPISLLIQT